ncbi:MAG: PadR family transcriptional regulator [Gemmatimonadaceae bacterium]|nr:PadR family transcriptional regulator [Gemmatimonadaceae bacterium]MDQ3520306.1 PadR family transcriptional regulator [Gemmatimonadota bacterium]
MAENRSRYAILGALTVEPMSGYDIRKFFAQSVSYFWVESYGQIYPMLKSLHGDGLIGPLPKGGSSRRTVYEITQSGRQVLASWLAEPAESQPGRNEILLKLFFAREGSPGAAVALLAQFRQRQEELAATYAGIAERITVEYASNPNLPNWLLTLSYGSHVSRALLQWCEEAERTLPSRRATPKVKRSPRRRRPH